MTPTQTSYRRRMLAVLAHIQDRLDDELTLGGLARIAGFSPYHFHRIFLGMAGETIGAHIRRLRLTRAAHRMEFTDLSVPRPPWRRATRPPRPSAGPSKPSTGNPPAFSARTPGPGAGSGRPSCSPSPRISSTTT